jgi:protein SCO1/2
MTPMTRSFRPVRRLLLRAAAGVAVATVLAACDKGSKPEFQGTDITGLDLGQNLALEDHQGRARTMKDFTGKVVVVFFGFIQCPDVCPTTLANLSQVMRSLGPDGDRVQVVFVTLDPERDTQAILAQYVTQFDARFLGLRGDLVATERAAKSFKVHYAKVPVKTGGDYTVEHSTGLYLFDPKGHTRVLARYTESVDALANDIRQLLA